MFALLQQWDSPNCPDNRTSCYDEVDLSLCFGDSAIFYGIVALFMVLAAVLFLCESGIRPRIHVGLLHIAKIVSPSYRGFSAWNVACKQAIVHVWLLLCAIRLSQLRQAALVISLPILVYV